KRELLPADVKSASEAALRMQWSTTTTMGIQQHEPHPSHCGDDPTSIEPANSNPVKPPRRRSEGDVPGSVVVVFPTVPASTTASTLAGRLGRGFAGSRSAP